MHLVQLYANSPGLVENALRKDRLGPRGYAQRRFWLVVPGETV